MRYTATIRSVIMTVTFILMTYSAQTALAHGHAGAAQVLTQVVLEGDRVYIWAASPYANPDGCSTSSYVALVKTQIAEPDWAVSAILTAFAAGKRVTFYFQGCVGTNWDPSVPLAGTFYIVP